MNQHNKVLHRFKNLIDLNNQSLPGTPVVEILGNRRVLIENHHGVAEYEKTRIVILVKLGKIVVSGNDLEICHMSQYQLVIAGCIDSVSVGKGCS